MRVHHPIKANKHLLKWSYHLIIILKTKNNYSPGSALLMFFFFYFWAMIESTMWWWRQPPTGGQHYSFVSKAGCLSLSQLFGLLLHVRRPSHPYPLTKSNIHNFISYTIKYTFIAKHVRKDMHKLVTVIIRYFRWKMENWEEDNESKYECHDRNPIIRDVGHTSNRCFRVCFIRGQGANVRMMCNFA